MLSKAHSHCARNPGNDQTRVSFDNLTRHRGVDFEMYSDPKFTMHTNPRWAVTSFVDYLGTHFLEPEMFKDIRCLQEYYDEVFKEKDKEFCGLNEFYIIANSFEVVGNYSEFNCIYSDFQNATSKIWEKSAFVLRNAQNYEEFNDVDFDKLLK